MSIPTESNRSHENSASSVAEMANQSQSLPEPCDLIEDFWLKSKSFYAYGEVEALLISLQDQHQYSVNRLLFCLWFSQMFQQLIDAKLFNNSQLEIDMVETSVTSLRKQRRNFDRDFGKPASGNLGKARDKILQAELALEQEIQLRLVSCLCEGKYPPLNQISAETLAFLIDENISLLCPHRQQQEESQLQKVTMLWIQHQDCYNRS